MNYDLDFYVNRGKWGEVINDDRYYSDYELMDNFLAFYNYAFSYLELPAPSRAQLEMANFLFKGEGSHKMLMAMRGLSKSLTSQIFCVWRFLNDPDEKILVMSAGAARAVNYTQFVKKLIALLPITRNMKPIHNLQRTSSQSFDVAGSTASDSPSMYAVGAGNQVTGMRASLVIYDDIETAQSVESATLSEKINTYAMEAQNLLMSGKDESITLCTPHSMSSIYISWIDKGYKAFIIPALYPENDTNYFGALAPFVKEEIESNPNCIGQAVDERLNYDFLMSKRQRIGKSKFKLQYMLDVSDADDLRYPLKLSDLIVMSVDTEEAPLKIGHSTMPSERLAIKHNGFNKDRLYAPSYMSEEKQPYEYKVMSIDPSGRGEDDTAVTIIYTLNTRIFLKSCFGLKGGYDPDTMEQIAKLCNFHNIHDIVIESNFGDGAFLKMLEPYIERHSPNTGIEEKRAIKQKEVRIIETLEPIMNQHRLVVDKELLDKDSSNTLVKSLTHQLSKITKERGSLRHDDLVDSLELAVSFVLDKLSDNEDLAIQRLEEERQEKLIQKFMDIDIFNSSSLSYASNF
jgi:hypothetical protein